MRGLNKFKEYFSDYTDCYTIIGGAACGLIMDYYGDDFRVTKDIDLVLIIENVSDEFAQTLFDFIDAAKYQNRIKSNGELELFRFLHPENNEFPEMIEISSRKTGALKLKDGRYEKLKLAEDLPSLSAILLDDTYYNFLIGGSVIVDGISILDAQHLIPFKAKAWMDLSDKKKQGHSIDSKNIKKHINDVARLHDYLDFSKTFSLPNDIALDMTKFLELASEFNINTKQLGVGAETFPEVLSHFKNYYLL